MTASLPGEIPVPSGLLDRLRENRARLGSLGRAVHWFDVVSSTNDVAVRLAREGAADGTLVAAEARAAAEAKAKEAAAKGK